MNRRALSLFAHRKKEGKKINMKCKMALKKAIAQFRTAAP